jgi:cystathionine beta-lyase
MKKETKAVHAGTQYDDKTQGTNTPVYTSTAIGYLNSDITYPRYFNTKNQLAVANKIAALENAESGMIFSSGMAAITSTLYAFLKSGDHVVFQKGLYGGTFNWVISGLTNFGIDFSIAEGNTVADFEKVLKPNTKILYIETPSNPLLKITDIKAAANWAKDNKLISVIDNTFASPVNQNPVDFGIDLVVHSATKYIGGHSDICAGAVAGSKKYIEQIWPTALNFGGSLDAQVSYMLERSIKTIFVRVKQQNTNALKIAQYLYNHQNIQQVYYPGLPTSDGYKVAKKQMKGFGGMLSFELKSGNIIDFQKKLTLIKPAVSLGGVDSIISAPTLTSHRYVPEKEKLEEGITEKTLRLSVGIEHPDDLIEDLESALSES